MQPQEHPRNLAARMGRWSAQHRKTAIFGWFAFVIASFALGIVAGTTKIDPATSGVGESGRADRILDSGFTQPASERVLIQSETLTIDDPAFAGAVEDVVARVSAIAVVTNVRSPLEPENTGQISADQRSALVDFAIRGDPDDAGAKIEPVLAAVDDVQAAHPELFVGSFGISADEEVDAAFFDDLKKAGVLSLPVTLIILIVVFGALVAAGIPLLLALSAIVAAFGLVALPSPIVPIDEVVYELILLIGLAVGVDYSMFYLKREREERAAGRSEEAALEAAAATSGRSVLISGITVIIAMAGMFLAGVQGMSAFAVGTIIVVAVAMLGSLTVLPAVLSKLGDNVERGRVPLVGRLRRYGGGQRSLVCDRDPRPPPAGPLARACRRTPPCPGPAGAPAPHRAAGHRHVSAVSRLDPDVQPDRRGLPRKRDSGRGGRQGAGHRRAGGPGGDRRAPATGARDGPDARAVHGGREPGRNRGGDRAPGRRQRDGRGF